nr:MAG TPA: ADP-ribosyltransferase [Caudoviricetes sp.]
MRIYHYTSIETLALILDSQKIRFNRLDRVDDLEESFVNRYSFKITNSERQKCIIETIIKSGNESLIEKIGEIKNKIFSSEN